MAKQTDEPRHQAPPPETHAPHRGRSAGRTYGVTFAGLPPCVVEAASEEEAARAAAQKMGVILERCEKAPDVVEVA